MVSGVKYRLPASLRDTVKEPIGKFVDKQGFLSYVRKHPVVVTVGDQVTDTLLLNNLFPRVCIIDYQVKRTNDNDEMKERLATFGSKVKRVENPAGVITKELWDLIKETFARFEMYNSLRIEVQGEEDLAALPAIFFAPENVTIIYGLPDRGVVVVPSTVENKEKVRDILAQM